MTDIDALTRRAVDAVMLLGLRAVAFATKVAAISALICIPAFLLGLAVFDDGMETVWIVLGGTFLVIAVGGSVLAIWRLVSLRRHSSQLAVELRQYLSRDEQARRTVIETVETGDQTGTSVIVWSRQFGSLDDGDGRRREFPTLGRAFKAVASFPVLMIGAALVTAVYAFLGVVFLVAAAL